jgi:hypothetical protein
MTYMTGLIPSQHGVHDWLFRRTAMARARIASSTVT